MKEYRLLEDGTLEIIDLYKQTTINLSAAEMKTVAELYLKYSIREYNRNLEFLIRQHILVADLHEKRKKQIVEYVINNFVSIDKLHETIAAAVSEIENKNSDLKIKNTLTMIINDINKGYAEMREDHFQLLNRVLEDLEELKKRNTEVKQSSTNSLDNANSDETRSKQGGRYCE